MDQSILLVTWLHNIYLRTERNQITVNPRRSKYIEALEKEGLVAYLQGYVIRVVITPKGKKFLQKNMYLIPPEEESWEKLTRPFQVLDALRGEISGEFEEDLVRLNSQGKTCTMELYIDAYAMNQQP